MAERLADSLDVSVLLTSANHGELPAERKAPMWSGRVLACPAARRVRSRVAAGKSDRPRDLHALQRVRTRVPESAIDFTYQIDLEKCKAHRECVKACGAIGAIDFARAAEPRKETFDLVLDLSREPLIAHDAPQGYAAPGADPLEQSLAAAKLVGLVGEFEKPRFTQYRERICAHGRSGIIGCTKCLDVCSPARSKRTAITYARSASVRGLRRWQPCARPAR